MENDVLKLYSDYRSDTIYTAECKHYDVYEQYTMKIYDKIYLSISEEHSKFLNTAFYIRGLKNVVFDFNGAVLTLHGRIQPFIIDECENVIIKNVTVEYDRSLYTEFDIISNENGKLRLGRKEHFPCLVDNGCLIPYSDFWENKDLNKGNMFIQTFDSKTFEGTGLIVAVIGENIVQSDTPPCEVRELKVYEDNGDVILCGNIPDYWHEGMTAVLAHEHRDKTSVSICRSKDTVIENYRILNGAGMGILGMYSCNITLDNLKLYHDELSHGVVTNAADAVHLVSCYGKIILKDCIIENMIDDALNIHNNFYLVSGAQDKTIHAYKFKENHFLNANFKMFGENDRIAIYKGHTMERRKVCNIRDVRIVDDYNIEIDTDNVVNDIEKGDIVENISTQPELTISGCRFGKANSHLRIQTRGKSNIVNSKISLPLLLTGDLNYWYEASPVNDLTIKNCEFAENRGNIRTFSECHPTPEVPFYHSGLKIINCTFESHDMLDAACTDDINIIGNKCTGENETLRAVLRQCGKLTAYDSENTLIIRY